MSEETIEKKSNLLNLEADRISKISSKKNENSLLSGKKEFNVNKVFISDFNATPGLAYVDLKISSPEDSSPEKRIELRALHDSGCAKSIIKTSVFNTLQKKGLIKIINPIQRMSIVSCTGEQQSITGLADIMLHFEGQHGIEMSFELNVIIHPSLSQDFLLGRDFTGSD